VPAVANTLDGGIAIALERFGQRPPLERIARKIVEPTLERGKDAYQPEIPVRVVEYERDCLLPVFYVLGRGLAKLLQQRSEHLIGQEVACRFCESNLLR